MGKEEELNSFTQDEGEQVIQRVYRTDLSESDKTIISKVIRGYIYLSSIVQVAGTSIKTIRDFFFPKKKKKKKKKKQPSQPKDPNPDSYTDDANKPLTSTPSDETRTTADKKNTNNHGRIPASAYTGAKHENCHHEKLQAVFVQNAAKGRCIWINMLKKIKFGYMAVPPCKGLGIMSMFYAVQVVWRALPHAKIPDDMMPVLSQ